LLGEFISDYVIYCQFDNESASVCQQPSKKSVKDLAKFGRAKKGGTLLPNLSIFRPKLIRLFRSLSLVLVRSLASNPRGFVPDQMRIFSPLLLVPFILGRDVVVQNI